MSAPALPDLSPGGAPRPDLKRKRGRTLACERCHARKVKCSGGRPCKNCSDPPVECVYRTRDRQIKLSQQYVDALVEENERLRNASAEKTSTTPLLPTTVPEAQDTTIGRDSLQNPLLEEPWFHTVSSLSAPLHIGEASDSAFATRFRQTLNTVCTSHIPRVNFVPDKELLVLSEAQYSWPKPARARFLTKVALSTVCRYYHMVRKSTVLESLEAAIKTGGNGDRLVICKLLALFALGEAYSARTAAAGFPGLAYFAQARKMVTIPAERPEVDTVEALILLGVYSYTLNRRHSAYIFASSAVRIGLLIGLQVNAPEHHFRDRAAREHRIRLYWSAYVFDRTCASKLGLPVSIADEDILLDLPSSEGLDKSTSEDFGDAEYEIRSIELSRIAAKSTREIYSRKKHSTPFSQRVQTILKDLNYWMDTLPAKFQLKNDGSSSLQRHHIVYLHLRFNQGILLATRPILLHVLRLHLQLSSSHPSQPPISPIAHTLSETSIQCARHSYQIISDAWIHGTFKTFDYFNTQYLFSAATILAISSLLGSSKSEADGENYANAVELLRQLDHTGSFGAKEFCEHVEAMGRSMAAARAQQAARMGGQGVSGGVGVPSSIATTTTSTTATTSATAGNAHPVGNGNNQIGNNPSYQDATFIPGEMSENRMTTGMALAEQSFQDFLAGATVGMQMFDDSGLEGLQTPYWPEIWGDEGWGGSAGAGGNV